MEFPGISASEGLLSEERGGSSSSIGGGSSSNSSSINRWSYHVSNLDHFFGCMYRYHLSKGMGAVLLSELCDLTSLAFTILFSGFLLGFVDWPALLRCHDEDSCGGDSLSSQQQPLLLNPFHHSPSRGTFFLLLYLLLAFAFWLHRCATAVRTISDAFEMSIFFREQLGLPQSQQQQQQQHFDNNSNGSYDVGFDDGSSSNGQWCEVLRRLLLLHERGAYRVSAADSLTAHDVVLRIMRKENFLIALINKEQLNLQVPWWIAQFTTDRFFLTQSLEWSLEYCILDHMFTDQFDISPDFLQDVSALQWRFQVVGLVHLLLLPFLLFFLTVRFFLQNAQQFHSSGAYLGPRQWSPLALWKFREFNELPHVFEERMMRSHAPAAAYIRSRCFRNEHVSILASCGAYITGSLLAALLLVSVLSEGALLYLHILDRNLLWYLGVLSALYAGLRALLPDDAKATGTATATTAGVAESPALLLRRVCAQTHHFPAQWAAKPAALQTRDALCQLYQFKAKLFLMEVFSVVLAPLVLCFSLPQCAKSVLDFIRDHSRYVEGVGVVCDYSLFDFARHGDENFGAAASGFLDAAQRANGGKLEKSFLSFQRAHPIFTAAAAGTAPAGAGAGVATVGGGSTTASVTGGGGGIGRYFSSNLHNFIDSNRQQLLASVLEQSRLSSADSSFIIGAGASIGATTAAATTATAGHKFSRIYSPGRPLHFHLQQQQLQQQPQQMLHGAGGEHLLTSVDTSPAAVAAEAAAAEEEEVGAFTREAPAMSLISSLVTGTCDMNTAAGVGAGTSSAAISSLQQQQQQLYSEERVFISRDVSEQVSTPASDSDNLSCSEPLQSITDAAFTTTAAAAVDNDEEHVHQRINPSSIEMSILNPSANASQLHNTSTAAAATLPGPVMSSFMTSNRSLFESSLLGSGSPHPGQQQQQFGLPSVLMSILRQENIDYENDFYWMDRFNHERVKASMLAQSELEQSASTLQQQQQQQQHQQQYQQHYQQQRSHGQFSAATASRLSPFASRSSAPRSGYLNNLFGGAAGSNSSGSGGVRWGNFSSSGPAATVATALPQQQQPQYQQQHQQQQRGVYLPLQLRQSDLDDNEREL